MCSCSPTQVWNPTDPYAAVDDATCPDGTACGRPLYPSLFITDITFDANNRSGDWQYGGAPLPPIKVCGTWKGVTKVAYGAACPTGTSQQGVLCTEADPIANQAGKNSWYLGTGTEARGRQSFRSHDPQAPIRSCHARAPHARMRSMAPS